MTRTLLLLAAASAAAAQGPRVGDINFYGLRKVTPEKVLGAVHLKPGDALPPSKGDLEERLEKIPGVVLARVEAVCCEGPNAVLYIGIEEKGAPHFAYRSPPAGNATLPEDLADSYRQFLLAVARAARQGNTAEDLTAGHSLMADPEARAFQEKFASFAAENVDLLRDALRNAAEAEQRALAAAVIGYAPKKPPIIDDLQYAMQDPDESVRANAMRSLTAIAVLAAKQPELGIRISPTWFIEMLNSIVLSDRVQSAEALVTLTDGGGQAAMGQLRERALPALAEMARWKTLRHALPPFLLLGRVAGMPDAEIQRHWEKGDREAVIGKAMGTPSASGRGKRGGLQ